MLYTINTPDQLKPILVGFRKSQGLSQKAMASKLGVSQQTYQVLESNPQNITVDRLFRVLAILGVKFHLSEGVSTNAPMNDKPGSVEKDKIAKELLAKKRQIFVSKTASKKEHW